MEINNFKTDDYDRDTRYPKPSYPYPSSNMTSESISSSPIQQQQHDNENNMFIHQDNNKTKLCFSNNINKSVNAKPTIMIFNIRGIPILMLLLVITGTCLLLLLGYRSVDFYLNDNKSETLSNDHAASILPTTKAYAQLHRRRLFDGGEADEILISSSSLSVFNEGDFVPVLKLNDLVAWQGFYSSLSGTSWSNCNSSTTLNDPCNSECAGIYIFCELVNGELRLTKLILRDMNIKGYLSESILQAFSELRYIDISGSKNKFRNSKCVKVPQCNSFPAYCQAENSGGSFCSLYEVKQADLVAWQGIYSSLQGKNWLYCNDITTYQNPCAGTCNYRSDQRVACELESSSKELRITEIRLQNNNLQGWIPESIISTLSALKYIDFRGKLNVFENKKCINIPRCFLYQAACLFDSSSIKICTNSPSSSPTTLSPTSTLSPSNNFTSFPTSSHQNQTIAPSFSPTAFVPNNTLSPTVPTNFTSTPTTTNVSEAPTQMPSTSNLNFTEAPTSSPSYNQTENPTSYNITSTPTSAPTLNHFTTAPTESITKAPSIHNGNSTSAPSLNSTSMTPTNVPTQRPTSRMNMNDLVAWQGLYLSLQGSNWEACNSNRMFQHPCGTSTTECVSLEYTVVCIPVNGELRISSIILPNNNLKGWLPDDAINSMTELKFLDLSNSISSNRKANIFTNTKCVDIPICQLNNVFCSFQSTGVSLCPLTKSPSIAPTSLLTASPSTSPTPLNITSSFSPTLNPVSSSVYLNDLLAWQAIYDSLSSGSDWVECGTQSIRNNPCEERDQGDCSSKRKILCNQVNGKLRITEISLPDNNLSGWFPASAFQTLDQMKYFDIRSSFTSQTPNTLLNTQCINAKFCYEVGRTCLFTGSGISLC